MAPSPKHRSGDVIAAEDVEARKVEWVWRDRIPAGMLTVVAGRPDQGKGLFAAHVAADISAAGGNVLYSASEDDHGLMTRPRLESAGANLNKVHLWRFRVPAQFEELANLVIDKDIRLVVMDPFAAHLSGGVSRHSDSVRNVTQPLSELAEATGAAFLVVEHALKKVGKNAHPLAAIGGSSSGLPAAARMAYIFGVDPDDSDRRLLCAAKSNLRDKPRALSFETDSEEVGLVGDVPNLVVQTECEFDPSRLLGDRAEDGKPGRKPDKRAAACEWLTQYLAQNIQTITFDNGDQKYGVRSKDVMEDAKQYGLTSKTVRNAADDMGILRNPPTGGKNCVWDLPDDIKEALGLATANGS